MEAFGLFVFGIPCAAIAVVLSLLLRWLKLLPAGVGPRLAGALLWLIFTGGLFVANYVDEIVVRPWRHQAEHLGAQYGTPFNLRSHSLIGFQDVIFEWTYQLTPAQAAALRPRCGAPTQAFGHQGCTLYQHWHGNDESLLLMLNGDQLYIVETA